MTDEINGVVPSSWIDKNKHMNMAFHTSILDKLTEKILESTATHFEFKKQEITNFYVRRLVVEYKREIKWKESWQAMGKISYLDQNFIVITALIRVQSVVRARSHIQCVPYGEDGINNISNLDQLPTLLGDYLELASIDPFLRSYR
jgi:acyl-CoA thioesterase FadM